MLRKPGLAPAYGKFEGMNVFKEWGIIDSSICSDEKLTFFP